jgi:hypothetical protein
MVLHYQPERLRYNSDQPTAITDVLIDRSGSSSRSGEIPLGSPTCSARTRQGRWALYPSGDQVVVVWPGGALVGPAVEVAQELDRLGDGQDDLDRAAVRAIRQFLTDPAAPTAPSGRPPGQGHGRARRWATGSAAPPTSPAPATTPQPAGPAHRHLCHTHRSRCPTPAPSRHQHEPPDRTTQPNTHPLGPATSTVAGQPCQVRPVGARDRFSASRWADLLGAWFPHLVSTELQHSRFAEIAPYHELIDEMLKTTRSPPSISGCGTSRALGEDHDVPSLRVGDHARPPPPGQPRQGHRAN